MGLTDLTVFVVAADERGRRLRDLISAWTVEGLLTSSVWVSPDDVEVQPAGPPRVRAERITADDRVVDDLFHIVGRRRLRTVRVVVGQLLGLDGSHDAELAETGRRVARALDDAMPRTADGQGTTLRCLNLLVPVSGASGVSTDALIAGWDVNAVVSSEDRPDVDRASAYVREPGNLVGHAGTALAACGGVLAGIDEGVLDVLSPGPSTSNGDQLQVVRVSVRAVVGEDVEGRLAVRALGAVEDEPLGPGRYVEWGRLAAEPERVVDDLTGHLLGVEPWASGRPGAVSSASRRQAAPWDAFKDAMRFDLRMFATVARWVAGSRKARIEDRATTLLVGAGSDTVIRFEPGSPERMAQEAARHLVEVDNRAREIEIERESAAVAFPDPGTWGALRDVAFAAVDGGALPAAVPEPRFAGVREILAPGRVAPDPLASFTTMDGRQLAPSDPAEARRYRLELGRRIQTQTSLAEPVPAGPDGEPADRAAVRVQEKAAAELESLHAERERADAWLEQVGGSVLWRLADDVGRRRSAFVDRQSDARRRLTTDAPPHEALVRAKQRLTRWWYGTLGLWLVALLVAVVALAASDGTEIWHWVGWCAGITLAAGAVLGIGNHHFYRAVRRYGWDVLTVVENRRRASEEIVFYGRESRRLDQLYGTLVDWIAIVGWVLHRPVGEVTEEADDIDDSIVEGLPAAFGVARTATEDDIPPGTVVQAVRRLHPVGWASGHFDRSYEAFRGTLTSGEDSGFIAADLDTLSGPFNPRRLLLAYWSSGDAASVLTDRAVGALRRAVRDDVILLPTRRVTRLGDHSEDGSLPEPDFYEAATRGPTTFVADMFSPAGMMARAHYGADSVAWLPYVVRAGSTDGVRALRAGSNVALRADVSRMLSPGDLRLFGSTASPAAARTAPAGAARAEPEEVAPTGAVFH